MNGTITVEVETNLDLPPTMRGLLQLAGTFDRAGYVRLARYLRACGDALSGRAPSTVPAAAAPLNATGPAVLYAHRYTNVDGPQSGRLALVLTGAIDDVQAIRLGGRYMLVPVAVPIGPVEAEAAHRIQASRTEPLAPVVADCIPAGDNWKC